LLSELTGLDKGEGMHQPTALVAKEAS